jgi:aspartate kinase
VIVMKFGGTSVADAERLVAVAEILRARLDRRPIVVLSAMSGVTDLLVAAVAAARRGDREGLDAILGDLAKRHRWAVAGTIDDGTRRHDLNLEVDAIFEELRQLLRSVRILGEGTPRAADTLLSYGELLSTRIAAAAFAERGLPVRWIDAREIMVTDDRHGAAEPDAAAVCERCEGALVPLLDAGELPLLGGFVGASPSGDTTTLGRGGSDTSAAVLGSALDAEEIQIWTDVDGLMTADPRAVEGARRLSSISFAEAAELAYFGARVLHPSSIAPAVERNIPVRILNSMNPDGPGTVILGRPEVGAPAVASIASRSGAFAIRVVGKRMREDPELLPEVVRVLGEHGVAPQITVSSEVAVTVVVSDDAATEPLARALAPRADVERLNDLAIVCVVGSGLADDPAVRGRVVAALASLEPTVVALGARTTSAAVALPESRLADAVERLHREFFG